jgi:hypothetical protein
MILRYFQESKVGNSVGLFSDTFVSIQVQKYREGVERQIRLQRVRKSRHLTNPTSRITAEIERDPVRGFVKQSRQGEAFTSQLQLRRGYDLDNLTLDATVADFARHDESGALIVG